MEIRMIHGLWRRIEGNTIKSYSTYQKAVEGGKSYEEEELCNAEDAYKKIFAEDVVYVRKPKK